MAKIDHALERKHDRLLDEVGLELHRQDEKWGEQNHEDGTGPVRYFPLRADSETYLELAEAMKRSNDLDADAGVIDWAGILLEEVLEALAEPAGSDALRVELIQTAAVCVQWALALDRRKAQG